ncbi:MAG: hypothetical protein AAF360_00460, partial [Pseudomonadota bacterium]
MMDTSLDFDTDLGMSPAPTGGALTTLEMAQSDAPPQAVPTINLEQAEKAAIVLVALGPEAASALLGELGARRIRRFARALNDMRDIPADVVDAVLAEFMELLDVGKSISGGQEETRKFLSGALESNEVAVIMGELESTRP